MIYSNKKSLISVVLFIILLISFISIPSSSHASSGPDIILNGNKLKLDVKPITVHQRTYVPVRAILENLGMSVTWNQSTSTVIGKKKGSIIEIPLKHEWSSGGTYNGVPFFNEHSPTIVRNGRTLIPVRSVATILGLDVMWNNFTKDVILSDSYKSKISIRQAYDILKSKSASSNNFVGDEYDLLPFGGYAGHDNYVLDNYYIFSVDSLIPYIDEDGNNVESYMTSDFNYCVNKDTGEIKVYAPDSGFITDSGWI